MPFNASKRTFKTARFSKDAKKAKLADDELCSALQQVMLGQADLGGGVFKKRLNGNRYRSIILAKVENIGFTNTFLPRRTVTTFRPMNYLRFAFWPAAMRA